MDGTNQYELTKAIINALLDMSYEEQLEIASVFNLILDKEEDIDNKRKHPRKKVFIPTDIKTNEKQMVDFISDISDGGMFIRATTISFFEGQKIQLDFTYNGVDHVNIKGEIVRVNSDGIGVKFIRG